MHGDDVSISDVLTKHGDNVFYQWHSKLRGCFISDVPTMHGDDVLSVTFLQYMETAFY